MENIKTLYELLEKRGTSSPEIIENCIIGELENDTIIIKPQNEKLLAVMLDMTIQSFMKMYGAYRHNESHKKSPADFVYDYCRDFKSKKKDIWENNISTEDLIKEL